MVFDAYADLTDEWVEDAILGYLETTGIGDALFRERMQVVGAQRMIKALGTFGYQIQVARNMRYMDAIPRTLTRLDRLLAESEETSAIHQAFVALGLFAANP